MTPQVALCSVIQSTSVPRQQTYVSKRMCVNCVTERYGCQKEMMSSCSLHSDMLMVHVYVCAYAPQAISYATLTCLPICLEHHRYAQSNTTAKTAINAEYTANTSSRICWYHGMFFSRASKYASPCVQAACSIKPTQNHTMFRAYTYFLHCLCDCANTSTMTQCHSCYCSTSRRCAAKDAGL